jgi:hypothetical protein
MSHDCAGPKQPCTALQPLSFKTEAPTSPKPRRIVSLPQNSPQLSAPPSLWHGPCSQPMPHCFFSLVGLWDGKKGGGGRGVDALDEVDMSHASMMLTFPTPVADPRCVHWQLQELLGEGGYGAVYKCVRAGDPARRPFAVKRVAARTEGGTAGVVTSTSTMRSVLAGFCFMPRESRVVTREVMRHHDS